MFIMFLGNEFEQYTKLLEIAKCIEDRYEIASYQVFEKDDDKARYLLLVWDTSEGIEIPNYLMVDYYNDLSVLMMLMNKPCVLLRQK